eukprot:4578242-Amphidinium_carterae.2
MEAFVIRVVWNSASMQWRSATQTTTKRRQDNNKNRTLRFFVCSPFGGRGLHTIWNVGVGVPRVGLAGGGAFVQSGRLKDG